MCTVACFIGFGEVYFGEVHPYMTCFCTLWQSAFSVTCLGRFLFGRGDNKCVGVNVHGGMECI